MSVSYVIASIILAIVVTSVVFVFIEKIEHKSKKINTSWLLMMIVIILSCTLAMVLIYHSEHDKEVAQTSYNNGYEDGVADTQHTLPNNEEMEEWFSSTQEVIVGENEGGDTAVHIIDHNGEEWVLYADSTQTK